MNCPTCKVALQQAGRTYKCDRCDGAWVKADVLFPMLEQSAPTLHALPWQPNHEDHVRACPECTTGMQTVKLGTVALDRCEPHGVWFDAEELAALIKQARKFRGDSQPGVESHPDEHKGLLKRLAGLFQG